MKKQLLIAFSFLGFSTLAIAHPGHSMESIFQGFMHPLTGWDHLLMMIAVGVWSVKTNKKACWKLPLAFIAAMMLGFMLSSAGLHFSGVESSIAASLIAMGALLMINLPINQSLRLGLVSLFAIFHGLAHGVEHSAQSGLSVMLGILISTGLLNSFGILIGSLQIKLFQSAQNCLAVCMLLLGGYALL